uniref:Uncharacterized protein n=1 Tax=Rhodosorus marinus TaxID=101924 RepID=A0A7S3A721_9RHOD|mmetsp:Transcript_5754/g.24256  ORF Transcript_5754/g.24256 Transcript_5754/m.24256 type:complete len:1007 (+) Transcript_5754:682-3702(+)
MVSRYPNPYLNQQQHESQGAPGSNDVTQNYQAANGVAGVPLAANQAYGQYAYTAQQAPTGNPQPAYQQDAYGQTASTGPPPSAAGYDVPQQGYIPPAAGQMDQQPNPYGHGGAPINGAHAQPPGGQQYAQYAQQDMNSMQHLTAQVQNMNMATAGQPQAAESIQPGMQPGFLPGMQPSMQPPMQGYVEEPTAPTMENAPRPRLESADVLARINDMDIKTPSVASFASSGMLQVDAMGRPIQGGAPQEQRWPATVACPRELYYNTSPRCARLTTNAFPNARSLAKKYGLPLGAVLQPMEDGAQLPVVNFGSGVVRCRRCRSYINFMCKFTQEGREWKCSMCMSMNKPASEYYAALDQQGYRVDVSRRPELFCSSYEVEAPTQYMVRPPMPPMYVFVLEVTPTAISSGLLNAAVAGIRDSLDLLPNSGRTRVGIITFDSSVHFYSFKGENHSELSTIVLPDINEVFLPTLTDRIAIPLHEGMEALKQLLDRLPEMYGGGGGAMASHATEKSAFGAALIYAQAIVEDTGGKIMAALCTRPKIGPGLTRDRSDNTALGTDRERHMLSPDSTFYKQKAVDLARVQATVDLIICTPTVGSFLDVATIAPLSKYSGGDLLYNPNFVIARDGHLLVESMKRMLGRETGWEAVMRIRASQGVRCKTFHGRFFLKSTDLLALPTVDPDKTFAVEFDYDDSLLEHSVFCVQIALLYTTSAGERRIRVHTIAIPVVSSVGELFSNADASATANVVARVAAENLKDKRLEDVRKSVSDTAVNALAVYKQSDMKHQSILGFLPESLSLYPLYIQGLLKTPLFSRDAFGLFGFRMDDKSALMHDMNVATSAMTTVMGYPTVLPLYPLEDYPEAGVYTEGENGVVAITLPPALPAMKACLRSNSALMIDDGITTIIWVGLDAVAGFSEVLVGTAETDLYSLGGACVYGDNEGDGGRVRAIIRNVRGLKRAGAPLLVVPSGSNLQARVDALMVEDRSGTQMSYVEFLVDLQSKVRRRAGTLKN